ncbi:MAG TPA: sodium:solute symporter [Vicinamibacterales bacterium]
MVLSPLDYAVITGYLLAITAFGSYFARFQKTTRDYFLTGRSVPGWAICCTVVATETSTLSFIGVPAQSYAGNMTFLQLVLGYIVGRFIVSLLFLPAYFRGELLTSYELLQRRFGGPVKNLSAVVFLLTRSLADGVRLYATALVISVVTQTNVTLIVLVLGAAMIVYTMRGGVAAVIWTDVVQLFVYVAGALIVFFSLLGSIDGGFGAVLEAGRAADKFRVFDFALDATRVYTFWAGLLGGIALTLATHGTDQFLVQRLLAGRSLRDAAAGLVASGFVVFAQFVLFLVIGVMLYTYYQQTPLPVPLERNDEILSIYVVHSLRNGAAGFIVAAIVAAALSPSINSMAATTINDFYLKYVRPDADEARLLYLSKVATVFWGVVQIGVAIAAQKMEQGVLDAGLSVLSLATGAVLGAFVLGTLRPQTGATAMMIGMLAGLLAMVGVWGFTSIAWTWYTLIGATVTVVVALAAAPLVRPQPAAA